MAIFVEQFIFLGQGDEDGFIQILVFIVMAVFWAVGGIIKARSEKQNQQDKIKSAPGSKPRPIQEPKPIQVQNRPQQKPPKIRPEKPVPVPQEKRPSTKPTFERLFTPENLREKMAKAIKPYIQPVEQVKKDQIKAKPVEKPVKPVEPKPVIKKQEPETIKVEPKTELKLDDPEQLRKAIIYHEVFGKCIGLRQVEEF